MFSQHKTIHVTLNQIDHLMINKIENCQSKDIWVLTSENGQLERQTTLKGSQCDIPNIEQLAEELDTGIDAVSKQEISNVITKLKHHLIWTDIINIRDAGCNSGINTKNISVYLEIHTLRLNKKNLHKATKAGDLISESQ